MVQKSPLTIIRALQSISTSTTTTDDNDDNNIHCPDLTYSSRHTALDNQEARLWPRDM